MFIRRSLFFLLLLSISLTWRPATAQTFKNLEGAVNIFGQFSGNSSGNGTQDKPTDSLGVLATARQSLHPWLGWEINHSYTRYSDRYSTPLFPINVQSNMHEVSGAYLVQGPKIPFLGLQPFGAVGVGGLIFLPTTVGGQPRNRAWAPTFASSWRTND